LSKDHVLLIIRIRIVRIRIKRDEKDNSHAFVETWLTPKRSDITMAARYQLSSNSFLISHSDQSEV